MWLEELVLEDRQSRHSLDEWNPATGLPLGLIDLRLSVEVLNNQGSLPLVSDL